MATPKALSYNAARAPCRLCGAEGRPCERCRLDYYCGKQHQSQDWQRHKAGCGVLRVGVDARLGRFVEVTRDVAAGTLLLREGPLVVVPAPEPNRKEAAVWCVGCLRDLVPVAKRSRCLGCGFPVCSKQCASKEMHRAECAAFQRAKYKLKPVELQTAESTCRLWTALGALRVHLASKERPQILELQSDYAELTPESEGPFWGGVRSSVTKYRSMWSEAACWLRGEARLKWLPEEELTRACGIVNVNGLAWDTGSEVRGDAVLLAGLSLLEHNCCPSAMSPALESGDHAVVASRDLRRGEHVSLDYAGMPLSDSLNRRNFLRGWGFFCRCARCLDPTERGLYSGSLCCPTCAAAGKRCMMTTRDTWSDGWRCEECGQLLMASLYERAIMKNAADELDATPARLADLERYIAGKLWPRGLLHPTHHLIIKAKERAALVGASETEEGALARVAALLRDLLSALDLAMPGLSEHRLQYLRRLHEVEEARAWAQVKRGAPLDNTSAAPQVLKVEKLLKEIQSMVSDFHGEHGTATTEARARLDALKAITCSP